MNPAKVAEMRRQLIAFAVRKPAILKPVSETVAAPAAVVLPYKPAVKRPAPAKATLRMPRQRQALAAAR